MTVQHSKLIEILHEPKLKAEAMIVRHIIKKAYGLDVSIKNGFTKGLFKFQKKLDGYAVQKCKKYKDYLVLTSKDIFLNNAKSKQDDWIFGIRTKQGVIIVSNNRLKTQNKKLYKKRIGYIVIHELGHALVKNQKHYKNYYSINPATGYKVNLGKHCINKRCIMSEIDDLKELDYHLRINYRQRFCKTCKLSFF